MHISSQLDIFTAGVFVAVNGRFPFQIGLTKTRSALGVVRIGGHRERDESGWACASREAFEEARIKVRPLRPPATYWVEGSTFKPAPWPYEEADGCAPVVVTRRDRTQITPMYLAYTRDQPVPTSETSALLLLSPGEIASIISGTWTLRRYISEGGIARVRRPLAPDLLLEPFPHLRILHQLLTLHPDLFAAIPKR